MTPTFAHDYGNDFYLIISVRNNMCKVVLSCVAPNLRNPTQSI